MGAQARGGKKARGGEKSDVKISSLGPDQEGSLEKEGRKQSMLGDGDTFRYTLASEHLRALSYQQALNLWASSQPRWESLGGLK